MSLGDLIYNYASASANAGNWQAVATILNSTAVQKTSAGSLISMARTLAALEATEQESTLSAFASTQVGKAGLQKLAATGLDFAHPITVGLIESLRNTLPAGVADKLLRLGNWTESLPATIGLPPVTAEHCQSAWSTHLAEVAAQQIVARRGVLESALRQLPISQIVGDSGLPTQQQVIDRIIEHCNTFGVTFGG